MNKVQAIDGSALVPSERAIPCGLYAGMFPFGAITVTLDNGETLNIQSIDLTYFDYQGENIDTSKQWVDFDDKKWQSWVEHNAAITTTKLVGLLPASFSGLVNITIACTQ